MSKRPGGSVWTSLFCIEPEEEEAGLFLIAKELKKLKGKKEQPKKRKESKKDE